MPPAPRDRWHEAIRPPAELRTLAARPGGVTIAVAGGSMEPTLRPGDRVRIQACSRARIGEVVLIETAAGDACMVHRVVLAAPGLPLIAHTGDRPGTGLAVAPASRLVGRAAELPRRAPGARQLTMAVFRMARSAAGTGARRLLRRH